MTEQKKKGLTACVRIVALMAAICIGVFSHAIWQSRDAAGVSTNVGAVANASRDSSIDLAKASMAEGMLEAWVLCLKLKDAERECDATDDKDEEFIVSLLKSFGFDCDEEFKWGYSEHRYLELKGHGSLVFVDSDYVRSACYGTIDMSSECSKSARDWISMINSELQTSINSNSCLNLAFHTDGCFVWCDCELPIELLRRLPSPEVQCRVLTQMIMLPEYQVKANKAMLDSFENVK